MQEIHVMWCELFIQSSCMSNLPSPLISYSLQKTTADIPHLQLAWTSHILPVWWHFFLPLHGLLKRHKRPNDLCETKSAGLVIELQTLPAINPSVDLPRFAFIILIRHKAQTITRNAQPQHRWIVMSHMLTTNVPVDCDDSPGAHKCQHYHLISISISISQ